MPFRIPPIGGRSAAVALAILFLAAAPARAGDPVAAGDVEAFLGLGSGALDGVGGPAFNGSALRTTFNAQAGDVLSFRFNFLTDEDPTLVFDLINDYAFVSLDGADPTVLAEVAATPFVSSSTGFSLESGLLAFTTTIAAAGTYTLGVGVTGVVDEMFPSALLLDDFRLNGALMAGGGFEAGPPAEFATLGDFAIVGDGFGAPAAEGSFQAILSTAPTAVPEPAALVSLLVGASGVLAVAVRRRTA